MRLDDGFSTTITYPDAWDVLTEITSILARPFQVWEISVTPPGPDLGGGIETSTMINSATHTKAPKMLVNWSDIDQKVAYDPFCLRNILFNQGNNQRIIITFPNVLSPIPNVLSPRDRWICWGWLEHFKPDELKIGERPTATLKNILSNRNNNLDNILSDGRAYTESPPGYLAPGDPIPTT